MGDMLSEKRGMSCHVDWDMWNELLLYAKKEKQDIFYSRGHAMNGGLTFWRMFYVEKREVLRRFC